VFSRETPDGRREGRRIALFFADGKLARIEDPSTVPSPAAGR
jgi:hypothetical protein